MWRPRARWRPPPRIRASHADAPGVRRRRRRAGWHAHIHGRRAGRGVRVRQADPREDGKTIVHAGGHRQWQAAKICNNMILGVSMIAVSEAFVLGREAWLDAQKLFDIASKSSGQCWSLTTYCPSPVLCRPLRPTATTSGFTRRDDAEGPHSRPGRPKAAAPTRRSVRMRQESTANTSGCGRGCAISPASSVCCDASKRSRNRWNFFAEFRVRSCGTVTHSSELGEDLHGRPAVAAAVWPKIPCENVRCAPREVLRDFNAKEVEFVANFKSGELNIEAGTNILLQSTNSAAPLHGAVGLGISATRHCGRRRQILNYAMPADLLGLSRARSTTSCSTRSWGADRHECCASSRARRNKSSTRIF